jgi:hypothetical protein
VVPAFVALLVIVTLPVALPVLFGENSIVSTADCPATIVVPLLIPAALNPVPLILTADTVTLLFPVFVTVTFELDELPTTMFPKFTLVVLGVTIRVSATPEPTSGIVTFELDPLTVNVNIPATLVVPVGAKFTLNVDFPPAANVSGTASPEVLNPVPCIETDEISALAVPEFAS